MDEVFAAVIQLYKRLKTDELTRVTLKTLLLQKNCWSLCATIYLLQVILCQINFHQLTQNMTTDLSDLQRFTKIYTNCSEIHNLQNLCFEF